MASMIYGETRFTNDVDMVADIPMGKVSQFCNAFQSPEYYVSESAIREAIQKRFQFNLLHPQSGLKVDIIIPHNTDYALVAASRVLRKSTKGEYDALFGSPEDVILNKLIYFQLGGGVGEKHLRDIAGILKLQKENLDLKYLDEWAARLGVSAEWSLVQKHVGNKGI